MARTRIIDFRRLTISLPSVTIGNLKMKKNKGEVSEYINSLIEEDMALNKEKQETTEELIESLREFRKENQAFIKDKRSSLEILRDVRYNGKY